MTPAAAQRWRRLRPFYVIDRLWLLRQGFDGQPELFIIHGTVRRFG